MRSAVMLFVGAAMAAQDPCDGYCQSDETCCFDYAGCGDDCFECCIDQTSYCVKPRGSIQISTCCPKWTVPCTVGSVGCCDPSTPWQLLAGYGPTNLSTAVRRKPNKLSVPLASTLPEVNQERTLSGPTAYALFTNANTNGLEALSIDVLSGSETKIKVSGPAQSWYDGFYGESARIFPWDAKGVRFVFADQDIAQNAKTVTVYTVDPKTGKSTSKPVPSINSYPLGLAWDAGLGALIVGTQTDKEAELWKVNPETGDAVSLAKVDRGADETSPTYYAAYITGAYNGIAYRVGNQAVYTGATPGVEQTSSNVSTWSDLPLSGVPASTTLIPSVGDAASSTVGFASLAMGSTGSLEAVSWGVGGTTKVLGQFKNAHAPSFGGGPLGYTAVSTGNGLFSAVACQQHLNPIVGMMTCKWSVYTASLNGGNVTENPLSPGFLFGNSVSLAGFGM